MSNNAMDNNNKNTNQTGPADITDITNVFEKLETTLKEKEAFEFAKAYNLDKNFFKGGFIPEQYKEDFARFQQERIENEKRLEEEKKEKEKKEKWESFLETIPKRFRNAEKEDLAEGFLGIYEGLAKENKSGILYGKNGPGKTHMAWCAAKEWKRNGDNFLFEKGLETLSWIKSNIGECDITEAIKSKYLSVPHLVIDEVDKIFESTADFVYLTYLVDIRYDEMLQTVIITNKLDENELISTIGQSVYSRLTDKDCVVCRFMNAPDRRRQIE